MKLPEWSRPQQTEAIPLTVPAGGAALFIVTERDSTALILDSTQTQWCIQNPESVTHTVPRLEGVPTSRIFAAPDILLKLRTTLKFQNSILGKDVWLDPNQSTDFLLIPNEGRIRATKRKTRVLVIDDSISIQTLLRKVIDTDAELECVGTVGNPLDAEAMIKSLRPDVLTMDIHMPIKSGVELLKELLPKYRLPTIMISALSKEDGTHVFDALEMGAVDYVQKPSLAELPVVAPVICEKIKHAKTARIQVRSSFAPRFSAHIASVPLDPRVVFAIGSSTGGTEALKELLTHLPAEIPPILIVQHIPPVFSKAFADRMATLCPFGVKEAAHGDKIVRNQVYIAPGGFQMGVQAIGSDLHITVQDAPPINRHKPSVDFLFEQLASLSQRRWVAAILTGMGADGARGLLKLKENGASTFAQDEATCVVYGMPREAVRLGAAQRVIPLSEMAEAMMARARHSTKAA
jgi:two-component system chemotaxis response regulator CheB